MQEILYHSSVTLSMKNVEIPLSFLLRSQRAASPFPQTGTRVGFFILFLFFVGILSFLEYNRVSKPPFPGVPVIL